MANNLHISYDLNVPGQDYEKVISKIKTLGSWTKIHKSFWYVDSAYSAKQAADLVRAAMDSSDTVYVVDSTNNDAYWYGLTDNASDFIQQHWMQSSSGYRLGS